MRVIARNVLVAFWGKHPETQVSLERWYKLTKAAHWTSMDDVQAAAPKAKVLNRERARFEVAGETTGSWSPSIFVGKSPS